MKADSGCPWMWQLTGTNSLLAQVANRHRKSHPAMIRTHEHLEEMFNIYSVTLNLYINGYVYDTPYPPYRLTGTLPAVMSVQHNE